MSNYVKWPVYPRPLVYDFSLSHRATDQSRGHSPANIMPINPDTGPVVRYDKGELRERLDPVVYQVTQEKGTER